MSDLLEKIGFKNKTHIGISLSANNIIELTCVEKVSGSVVKYASGNVKYNGAIREIIDYEEFNDAIRTLFYDAELDPTNCIATVNLPNVHFGIAEMEPGADVSVTIDNLQTDLEDIYIFKKSEPMLSYTVLDSTKSGGKRSIVYGVLQAKVINAILDIFDSMGCEIERIDTSYTSLLRALQYCKKFNKYMEKEERTSVFLITPNSCCTFYLESGVLKDYIEEPLAVKSYSDVEAYDAMARIAENNIAKNGPSMSLLVISETDEINAEILSTRINFQGDIDYISKNVNTNDEFIEINTISDDMDSDPNSANYITIESVGAAVSHYIETPISINFLPAERINKDITELFGHEVDAKRFSIAIILAAIIFALLIALLVRTILNNQLTKINEDNLKSRQLAESFRNKLNQNQAGKDSNVFPVLKQLDDQNKNIVATFSALSTEIPAGVYITKFVSNAEGGIGIIGQSKNGSAVQEFVKSLREYKDDVVLTNLSSNSGLLDSSPTSSYTFEIKTSQANVNFNANEIELTPSISGSESGRSQYGGGSYESSGSRQTLLPPPAVI